MSDKKEEKADAAADRIKAAALTVAKGLDRAQAERAAAAAARNDNAYGQKEERSSRWQEKREAKSPMYLTSTEKAVRLGERKDLKSTMTSVDSGPSQCQRCFQTGHLTYECKNARVYISRPSLTQQLKNPKLMLEISYSYDLDLAKEEKQVNSFKKSKRKHRSKSDSEASVFDSDSSSVTGSDKSSAENSSESSSSDSEERRRKKRNQKTTYSSSSSDSDSSSDSE